MPDHGDFATAHLFGSHVQCITVIGVRRLLIGIHIRDRKSKQKRAVVHRSVWAVNVSQFRNRPPTLEIGNLGIGRFPSLQHLHRHGKPQDYFVVRPPLSIYLYERIGRLPKRNVLAIDFDFRRTAPARNPQVQRKGDFLFRFHRQGNRLFERIRGLLLHGNLHIVTDRSMHLGRAI